MRLARRVLVVLGGVAMGYAVLGALTDHDVALLGVLVFLGAVLVGHDLILLPAVIGVGVLVGRIGPARLRTGVRAGLVVALAVAVVGLPLVLNRHR